VCQNALKDSQRIVKALEMMQVVKSCQLLKIWKMKTELIEDQLHLSSRQFISFVMRTVKKEDVHKACYTQPYK